MDNPPSLGLPLIPSPPLPPTTFPPLSLDSVPTSDLRGIVGQRLGGSLFVARFGNFCYLGENAVEALTYPPGTLKRLQIERVEVKD